MILILSDTPILKHSDSSFDADDGQVWVFRERYCF